MGGQTHAKVPKCSWAAYISWKVVEFISIDEIQMNILQGELCKDWNM